MFNVTIMIFFILFPILVGVGIYVLFPRKTKNILCKLIPAWNKRYVVCHMNYQAGLSDIYNVIPNPQGLTQVGKYSYDLTDKYVCLYFLKRAHFVLDENNSIPRAYSKPTNEDIIFQAAEIQTALNNNVMEYLFSKKKEVLIIGFFILATINILAIVYNIYAINALQDAIVTISLVDVKVP